MVITDGQVHVWREDHPARPWPDEGHEYAHGPSYGTGELLADMARAGVDRAVLVPPSFEGDRNDACLAAAREFPDRFAVMGRLGLRDEGARDAMPGWLDQPGMLGIRLTFGRGLQAGVDDRDIAWFWSDAERYGVPVMVSAATQIDRLPSVLRSHPQLRLVVDRLGVPHGAHGAAVDAALERLCQLARLENVAVKATGLPDMADEPFPFPSIHDRFYRVLDAFGSHRVFWASDLTRMPCDYGSVVTLFAEALSRLSGEERQWVLGRGISTWLGWDMVAGTPHRQKE